MRIVVGVLAVLLLTSCGVTSTTVRTPTPDTKTPAGYRIFVLSQVAVLNGAVEVVNDSCKAGAVAACAKALGEQTPAYKVAAQAIKTTTPPSDCVGLFSGYVGLPDLADPFFSEVQTEVDQGNANGITTVIARRYPPFIKGKTTADSPLPNDGCR